MRKLQIRITNCKRFLCVCVDVFGCGCYVALRQKIAQHQELVMGFWFCWVGGRLTVVVQYW
jgi:hypothetical protein